MINFIQTEPVPVAKIVGNVRLIGESVAKELVHDGQFPKHLFIKDKNGQTEWATFRSFCKLTNQAIYVTPQYFVALEL